MAEAGTCTNCGSTFDDDEPLGLESARCDMGGGSHLYCGLCAERGRAEDCSACARERAERETTLAGRVANRVLDRFYGYRSCSHSAYEGFCRACILSTVADAFAAEETT